MSQHPAGQSFPVLRKLLLPAAALVGLIALSGCYYGPYGYGYPYGYPGYAYAGPVAAPAVVGGVVVGGGWGWHRGYWR